LPRQAAKLASDTAMRFGGLVGLLENVRFGRMVCGEIGFARRSPQSTQTGPSPHRENFDRFVTQKTDGFRGSIHVSDSGLRQFQGKLC
jgi:hypothetical protein